MRCTRMDAEERWRATVHDDEHGRGVDVGKGQVAYKLSLDDCADVREVGAKVGHVADGRAGSDGCIDLA